MATGLAATGLAATLATTALVTEVLVTKVLATVFGAVLEEATFEAEAFEPVAFAAVFAALFDIALLLFFVDFAPEAFASFRGSFSVVRARLLGPLRLTAAAFLHTLD